MNQMQAILTAVKKWGFWVICGLAVLVGLGIWLIAQQSVQASIRARKDQLEGLKTQVSGVRPGTPNSQVIEATRRKIEELKTDVYNAWVSMYQAQKEKNKWPSALGDEFLNWVNQPGRKFGDPIPERFREIYLNFIDQHFPTLFEIVNILRPKGTDLKRLGSIRGMAEARTYGTPGYGGGLGYPGAVSTIGEEGYGGEYPGTFTGGGYPGAAGSGAVPATEMEGIVEWNPQNIAAIKQRFAWTKVPSSEAIWNAQEDLWVYEALLRIIAKTNEGATGPHNAAVKRINAIEIGPDAARYLATSVAAAMPMGSGSMGSPGAAPMTSGPPMSEEAAGGEYGAGYGMVSTPLYGRYVDASGRPLPPGSQQPFAEFKMMPVRLDLMVDQRRIDQLLVNCVNSDMPVRITRVLIRPGAATRGTAGGYGGIGSTGIGGTMSESDGEDISGPGYGTGPYGTSAAGATTVSSQTSYDVPVIIEGIIYIFNPPNEADVGKPGAPELPSDQTLVPPTVPQAGEGTGEGAPPAQPGQALPGTVPPGVDQQGVPGAPPGVPQSAQPMPPAQGVPLPPGNVPAGQPAASVAPENQGAPPTAAPVPGGSQGALAPGSAPGGNVPAQPTGPQLPAQPGGTVGPQGQPAGTPTPQT